MTTRLPAAAIDRMAAAALRAYRTECAGQWKAGKRTRPDPDPILTADELWAILPEDARAAWRAAVTAAAEQAARELVLLNTRKDG